MIPSGVHKIGESIWLDVRESSPKIRVITCEPESVRPKLLPYEKRVTDTERIRVLMTHCENVLIVKSMDTTLPEDIVSKCIVREYPKERLLRLVPRKVNVWIQWFPHKNEERAKEFRDAFDANVKCDLVDRVIQLSEKDYDEEFLRHDKVTIRRHDKRITYNDFLCFAKEYEEEGSIGQDMHILVNADMEWTREASLGLEHHLWEKELCGICVLRWEDRDTIFGPRANSQDVWGFEKRALPDGSKMVAKIPLGNPGCDNRFLMELLLQGYRTLNQPIQFPTIHHHKTEVRDYTPKDMIPRPYLVVRPQWDYPLVDHKCWLSDAVLNLRNMVNPVLPNYAVSKRIGSAIRNKESISVGKIGQIEAEAVSAFHQLGLKNSQTFGWSIGEYPPKIVNQMFNNAGVFPKGRKGLDVFSRLYQDSLGACDILSMSYPWLIPSSGEYISNIRGSKKNQMSCRISATEPFLEEDPYTRYLSGKRVAVISPFTKSMKSQLSRRELIWGSHVNDFLPETTEWIFIRAPLSAGLVEPVDKDWDSMISRLTKECFPPGKEDVWPDVVLSGFGPGGLCLNEAAKARGKVGISLGGSLQLLFGIRGKRWDAHKLFKNFFNEYWVRPSGEERPPSKDLVERGCYW